MGILDNLRTNILNWLLPGDDAYTQRRDKYLALRDYYEGNHKRQLKVKPLQADDNLTINFAGLVVERSISMLLGGGVEFELEDEAAAEYLEEVWKANSKEILLHKIAQYGSVYGTPFVKLIPHEGKLPRLVPLDPNWMTIETLPEDIGTVVKYTMRFNVMVDGKEIARKEETLANFGEDGEIATWEVVNYQATANFGGRWVEVDRQQWPYPFAPIVHCQNLPQADNVYGQADIEDIIESQDRFNFVASNISRIIRYHAHPKTWGRGANLGANASWGADEMVLLTGENATLANLEMQSDLASSLQFANVLRQAIFDVSRAVDISSLKDKLGALTNFGIRVLYTDALAKNKTKQLLYGELLTEINRRLLVLNGTDADPGEVRWKDALPVDLVEEINRAKAELEMQVVSRETVAARLGNDWELEQERISGEKAGEDNIGAALLRAFDRGQ